MKKYRFLQALNHIKGLIMGTNVLLFLVCLIALFSGCSDSDSTLATNAVISSAVMTGGGQTLAIASVTDGETDVANAEVSVNGITLDYGLPLAFLTQEGIDINIVLPVYFAELNQISSGDVVQLLAWAKNGALIYNSNMVTIPGSPTLTQPVTGQDILSDQNVSVSWNAAIDAVGYIAGYAEAGTFDETSSDDEDSGMYLEYVDSSVTEMSVPSLYTVAGDAVFSVDAVSGDTDIFMVEEDPGESFFIVSNSDWIEAQIVENAGNSFSRSQNQTKEARPSQGLRIVKEYTKKIEGYRFKVRECDPNQIQYPGTVTVGFKLRRYKASIAFVTLIDINGKEYASWKKARIYKSKSKKYYPSFSVSPGTTVVFGSHDASYRGGTYSY
jgi:hypothetical protein